jgi:alpha-D-ribose 1-methylphosphonate 5-triphosphate diphosphatase
MATERSSSGCGYGVLCADYHAPSLLFAIWKLILNGLLSLPEAVRLVTFNPARAVGLADELGSLEPGKPADVVVVDPSGPVPTVELTLRAGAISSHAPTPSVRHANSPVPA